MAIVNPSPNIDTANEIVKNNLSAVNHNPELAAAGIQSGSIETANTLFATSKFAHLANAVDDHIQTYNSDIWFKNALQNAPDVYQAIARNGGMNK